MADNMRINLKAKDDASKVVNRVRSSFSKLGRETKTVTGHFGRFQNSIHKTDRKLINITKDSNRASMSFRSMGKSLRNISFGVSIAKVIMLGNALGDVVQSAFDMIETNNLFEVSLGHAVMEADKFVTSLSKITGLDVTNLKGSIGTFALLARSMGVNEKNAETLATTMTTLSLDLASLTNIPIAQVMKDLRSGLVGQSETVYKYGLDVTEASLKAEAMAQGISKSVRNMSQGEKMALRYSVMIKKSTLAQTDFANTIETPANQMRILTERLVTLTRSIGTLFIPALAKMLPYLNAIVQVTIEVVDALARLFGYRPDETTESIRGIGDNASSANDDVNDLANTINKTLRGSIDELNVLSIDTGTTGVDMGDPNDFEYGTYDSMIDGIIQKSDLLAESIRASLSSVTDSFKSLDMDPLVKSLKIVVDSLEPLVGMAVGNIKELWNDLLKPLGKWTIEEGLPNGLKAIAERLGELDNIDVNWTPIFDGLMNLKDALKPLTVKLLDGLVKLWDKVLVPLAEWTINDVLPTFLGTLSTALTTLDTILVTLNPLFSAWWTLLQDVGKWVADEVVDELGDLNTKLGETNTELNNLNADSPLAKFLTFLEEDVRNAGIKLGVLRSFLTVLERHNEEKTTDMKSGWTLLQEGIDTKIKSIKASFELLKTALKILKDKFVENVNRMISKWKEYLNVRKGKIPTFTGIGTSDTPAPPPVPTLGIGFTQQARGGILDGGSLFQAGEFGRAEMVGSFGGKTTVMPLEDSGFVSAMYRAVYDATVSAMQSGEQTINVITQLDGEEVYRNQEKVARNRGRDFGFGNFAR